MTANPICIIRGLCNNILQLLGYDVSEWVNPKLWKNGYFSIYLPHQEGSGHEQIDILAESITRYENDRSKPNGTYSLRFFARTNEKFSTCFEFYGPYDPDLIHLSKYLFESYEEWGCGYLGDEYAWVDENGDEYDEIRNWKYIVDVEEPISENAECEIQTRLDV